MGCVYMAVCKVNGKRYIGKTVHSLARRIHQHEYLSKKPNPSYVFHKAIKKYGVDTFDWFLLLEHAENDFLSKAEQGAIFGYNTFVPCGYNMTRGGEGTVGVKWGFERRIKIEKAITGRKKKVYCLELDTEFSSLHEAAEKTGYTVSGISYICKNKNRYSKNLHFCFATDSEVIDLKKRATSVLEREKGVRKVPEELKRHLSEKLKGIHSGEHSVLSRPVLNVDTGVVFASMGEAERFYSLRPRASLNISSCCRGKLKTAYGFRWKYAEDIESVDIPRGACNDSIEQ